MPRMLSPAASQADRASHPQCLLVAFCHIRNPLKKEKNPHCVCPTPRITQTASNLSPSPKRKMPKQFTVTRGLSLETFL